ncbi:hypothetical protein ACF3MZ_21215 [Paenibacillaceae bacterium WGS1546]|uniref:hypothetical protein n=1 Tax=Cohnella sp. WGS1546 TaxID=3366810 RepID=UPI00372D799F
MEELLTLSCNFGLPIGLLVGNQHMTAVVEEIDDDRVRLAGEWYPLREVRTDGRPDDLA